MIGKRLKMLTGLMVCLLLMGTTIYGEEAGITLEIGSREIEMGSSTDVTLTLHNDVNPTSIQIRSLDQFDILSNSQSSSTQIINGESSKIIQYHLTLMPKDTGIYKLQAVVRDGDQDLMSNEIEVMVHERNDALDDKTEDVFITTNISDDQVYLGQPIIVTYDLYTRYNLEGYDFIEPVTVDGVVMDQVSEDNLDQQYVTINDNKYLKYQVKQLILSPLQSGRVEVPSFQYQVNISTGDFFGRGTPKYLETEAKSIEVVPLPQTNKPSNYEGLIGDFDVTVATDQEQVALGDAMTMSIDIHGQGALEGLGHLYPKRTGDLAIYETDKGIHEEILGDHLSSTKSYEVIVVPEVGGQVTVPSVEIPYFNTSTGAYDHLIIPEQSLTVNGPAGLSETTVAGKIENKGLTISQVTYPQDQSDTWQLSVKKAWVKVIGLGVLLTFLLVVTIRWVYKSMVKNPELRVLKSKIKNARTENDLYNIANGALKEATGFNMKIMPVSKSLELVEDQALQKQIVAMSKYFEYDRFYKAKEMKVLKAWLLEILKSLGDASGR